MEFTGKGLHCERGNFNLKLADFKKISALLFITMVVVVLPSIEVAHAQSTPVTVGYRDFDFGAAVTNTPTGEKPESKIWFNDGFWWGSLWSPAASAYTIHKFSVATQSWTSTGVTIDDRGQSKADALWTGAKLYVASHIYSTTPGPASSGQEARLYRYSYNSATDTYTLDAGFPVNVNSSISETLVLDRDSTGKLWITWTESGKVKINSSTTDDLTWGTPFDLPGQGADVDPDDISSVVAFDADKIGVLWSNRNDLKAYFAVHLDSDADATWQAPETALADAVLGSVADDHINLKMTADGSGNLYSTAKTRLSASESPHIYLLQRTSAGVWSRHLVGKVKDGQTRPIVLVDDENGKIYVFMMSDVTGDDVIYMKSASLLDLAFPAGAGTSFIQSATETHVSNPSSTKQPLDSGSGLLVIASDQNTLDYFHNYLDLSSSGDPSISSFTPSSGAAGTTVTINGNSFTGAVSVNFNGIAASAFTLVSDGQIQVNVPDDATTGKITVTTVGGQDVSLNNFSVIPTIASFTPTSGFVATEVTITGSNFSDVTDVKFNGVSVSSLTIDSENQLRANVPSSATTGKITVVAVGGSTLSADDFTVIASSTTIFNPAHDSWVRLSTPDGTNANSTTIRARATTTPPADTLRSYLKFEVTGLSGAVLSAKVRLNVSGGSEDGGSLHSVSNNLFGTSTPWTESAVTWNNGPVIGGTSLGSAGNVSVGQWAEFDVTSVITGDGTYSFGLKNNSSDDVQYHSKETLTTTSKPELVIQTSGGGTPAPTISSFTPTSGVVGTSVTITGTNFTGASDVKFNTTSAISFTVNSATAITATAPTGASTGKISVTTAGGTGQSATDFTVTLPPPPTITSFTPISGVVGTSVTITGTDFTGASDVKFNTTSATTFTVNSATQITATVPTGATTGKISVTTPGGTVQSGPDFTVTSSSPPTISSFTPTSGPVGTVVTITGANFSGASNVQFNATSATSFTVNSATEISATVPTGATTGAISVTTSGGAGTSATNFTVTSSGSTVLTFNPIHDTWTRKSTPTSNFGATDDMRGRSTTTDTLRAFVKFSVSGINGVVVSAKLRMQVINASDNGGSIYSVSNNLANSATPWTETTLNWSNAPTISFGGGALSSAGAVTLNEIVEFNVGAAITGNGTYSFALHNPSSNDVHYSTREGIDAPDLEVVWQPSPAPIISSFTPSSGQVGAQVTITGSNFFNIGSVQFNGTVASAFTVNSATQITATVPAGATSGKISVTNDGGTGISANDFTVLPPTPVVSSFTPASGAVGAQVTITGSDFSTATGVKFNATSAITFTVNSATQITATVPAGATTGKVSVINPGGTGVSATDFTLLPAIASFTPASALVGVEVTITGTNFTGATAVKFNNTTAAFIFDSDTQVRANVPAAATSGKISVTTPTGTALSATDFTVLPPVPVVSSFTPTSGLVGALVTITGSNFNNASSVLFNGSAASTFTVNSNTEITATVPASATTGKISITTPSGTGLSATDFTVPPPTIASFTPASGVVGTEVTITGANFTGASAVKFNDVSASTFTVDSATQIRANAPAGATTGKISVTTVAGTAMSATDFGINPPIITTFSPSSAAVGVEVTITGNHFTGASSIQFNGTPASTFTVDSNTQIRANVPAGATTGKISVTTAAGIGLSATDFTVIPPAPVISSFTPASGVEGTEVTITGSNFSGASSVLFNDLAASSFTVNSNTQITATVPANATNGKISVTTIGGTGLSATDFIAGPIIASFSPASAVVGAEATITGSNFTDATSVKFNGVSAFFVVDAATQIRATVPALATSGKLSVTSVAGTALSADDFLVVPTISSFTPASGPVGGSVTINGSALTGATEVKFNGVSATEFTVNSSTQISATVPSGASTGKISVTTAGGTVLSGADFTVFGPVIASFTPSSGLVGVQVTITGSNFTGATEVAFNGAVATSFTVNSATQIVATAPNDASTGKISVTTPGGSSQSSTDFTVIPPAPTISSFTPGTGLAGVEVTITGSNFVELISVNFNGTSASTFTVDSPAQIRANIPAGATSGKISVTTTGGTALSATDFLMGPTITSFIPASGLAGTEITVTGTNLNGVASVKFNGVASAFIVDSITQLRANVPTTASTGKISVTTPGGAGESADDFIFIPPPPAITSFAPASSGAGVEVTITGANLSGASAVKFNGLAASTYTVDSATQIRANVPVGATTGKISVTTLGGTGLSATDFTVLAPVISSFSPASSLVGVEVTITGSNFTGATDVKFNGASAAPFIVDSDTQIRANVPGAAATGKISVTTSGGAGQSVDDFIVIPAAPIISSFTPSSGLVGAEVTITGSHFTGATEVKFNGNSAPSFIVDSNTQIRVNVPATATTGKINVITAGGTAVSATDFTVGPIIASFSPASGIVGTEVTIAGNNFVAISSVKFNGLAAFFIVDSQTQIRANVPSGATSGKISVTTSVGTSLSDDDFLVVPNVSSFTPVTGPAGTEVTITGSAFTGATAVQFNGTAATTFTVESSTQIKANVPAGATSGKISVTTPGGTSLSPADFTVSAPSISSFSPTSGPVLTEVTITGNDLNGASDVQFNGVSASTFTVDSNTQIRATVPLSATTGKVSVTTGGGTVLSATDYTVVGPVITSFSPASGLVGVEVTLTGSHFTGATDVTFNGAAASSVTIDSDTQIRANVPAAATTGKIGVTTAGGTALSPTNFTVIPPAPAISSFTPTSGSVGAEVTITGSNFVEVTAVKFNGTSATAFTVESATQITANVPAGATTGKISVTTTGGTGQSAANFSVAPIIVSFSPGTGAIGTEVTITGLNFMATTSVKFNGTAAFYLVDSDVQIRATVPSAATNGKISITTLVGTGLSTDDFLVLPAVTSFTPGSGPVGTEVTINGTAFTGATAVKFNGLDAASFIVDSATQIRATVPDGATTGAISVTTPSGTALGASDFTVLGPVVTSFTPSSGLEGASVTITGNHFLGASAVKFNGAPAAIFTVNSATEIQANVPFGATSGKISVTTGGGTAESATDFTVIPPAPLISSFTPASGLVGTEVTITGSDLAGATSVKFNNVSASSFTVDSATQIRANVPASSSTGKISVTTPGGTALSATDFGIGPFIASFTPASAVIGTEVTITGSNFNGVSSVKFNATAAFFLVDSPTQIRTTIPAATISGKISVINAAATGLSATDFVVTPVFTSFTPASGLAGTEVTITGNGLAGANSVTFNGTAATSFTVDSPTQVRANVPVGAGSGKISVITVGGGTAMSATDFNVNAPSITSFAPSSGLVDTEVTITGSNFSGATEVKFNATAATIYTIDSATQIRANVPAGASHGKISVITGGGTALSATDFTVIPPAPIVSSFTPTSGAVGTEVTITGSNFVEVSAVSFNGTAAATFTVESATQIKANVPVGTTTGKISVTTLGGTALSADDFTAAPVITSFSPASGLVGVEVTITGLNFSVTTNVKLNGVNAFFIVDTPTQIQASVPSAGTSGKFSVTTAAGTGLSTDDFLVTPAISSFTPTSGPVSALVTITGSGFSGATEVKFNGLAASSFTVNSPTEIQTNVPPAASAGKISVTVSGGGTALSAADFTVLGPTISSFTPSSALVGVEITITGTNLGGATSVAFNGTSATTFTVDSPTQVRANVPDGATTGKISITTGGGTALSATDFTVIPPAPVIASFTPASGDVGAEVTITGSNLAGASAVMFNNLSAASFTIDSPAQIRATVPASATTGKISVTTFGGTGLSGADFLVAPIISSFTPSSAAVGSEVTLTGLNFTGANSVKFNGTAAFFIVDSDTQIRVTVPSAATSGKLSVTTDAGTSLSANDFLVLPALASFSPASGAAGIEVTISGSGFTGATSVKFNGAEASSFTVDSPSQIRATVPVAASTGKISVTTAGGTVLSASDFTLLGPTITSFSPASGLTGIEVTITGTNFTGATEVKFNGEPASIFTVDSATQLRANVPASATTGKISVTTGGGIGLSATDFTVIPPAPIIASFTPANGLIGVEVTITGSHFSGATEVKFNATSATTYAVDSATQIRANVPAGASAGKISVTTPGGTALSSTDFFVGSVITSFSPTSGLVGVEVTIIGTNFESATSVKFNGAPGTFTIDSATQIRANVPAGASTGKINVTNAGGTISSVDDFTVVPPAPIITSFSPASAQVPAEVTITGSNFSGATDVAFNGVAATSYTVDSATQIRANLPSGASTGKISVTTLGGTALSAADFTVIPPTPAITFFSPTIVIIGSEVTITGTDFLGATTVKINTTTVPVFTVDSATQIRATVPVGATSGKISVTTLGGTAISTDDLTIAAGPSTTLTFQPLYDTYVRLSTPTSNFGTTTTLRLRKPAGEELDSYLKFDVTGITGAVLNAKLRLSVVNGSSDGGAVYVASNFYKDTSTPWTQTGMSWNNAPGISGAPLSSIGAAVLNATVEYDVTAAITGDGTYSFGLANNSSDDVHFSSQEGGIKPLLLVEYSTGAAAPLPTISSFTPANGAVGTEVTITGANFTGAAIVKFNATTASTFTVDSATQIRANVPSGATTGKISVTTAGGTALSAFDFTVSVSPGAPTIASFTPTSGAAGLEVTITGANLTGATSVQFNGAAAGAFTVDNDTQIRANVPAGATTGKISVTTPSGTGISGADFSVTTSPTAPSIASFTPTNGVVGTEVTITGANFTGATSVQFNGTTAGTFTVDSATQIRANVPSGATTGKISVTTPGGTALSINDFSVVGGGTTTVTILPFHDAYVSLASPTNNYGNSSTLRIRKSSSDQRNAFMKFQVTGMSGASIVSAKLRLKVTNDGPDGGTVYNVSNFYLGTTDEWLEDVITWNVAPAISGAALSSVGAVVVGTVVEFDVTSTIPGNGTYSFAITNNSSNDVYYSSSAGADPPELVIQTGSGSAPPSIASFTPLSGGVGAEVTITGANFTGATSVLFNGAAATTFAVDSDAQIRANVPSGATSGKISVTTPNGTGISGADFSVTASPNAPAIASFTPTGGVTGTEVTITGANFTGATSVKFNATAGIFLIDSDTQIRANVPPAATTGAISVTTPNGTGTSSAAFTVTTSPTAPSISSFTPASGVVGTEVTITGANFTGATSVQFNGTAAGTFTVDSATQIRANVPSGATTGKISVTTAGGAAQSVDDFTVNTAATVTATFTPLYDAYVRLSTPTSNFGTTTTLRLRKSAADDLDSYLKFDVTGISGTIVSARLRLKVINASTDGGEAYPVSNFYKSTSTPWTQTGLNWNNAPVISGSPLSTLGGVAVSSVVEYDVTAAIAGNGTYSFGLSNNSSDDVHFSSQEGDTKPELVVDYSTGAPAVPAITSFTPGSGAVGAEVTIAGVNFTGATSVQFNGTTAGTFIVDSATQIRATVPSGATTGKISVITAGGTALSASDFTVSASPGAPTIASFTPTSGAAGLEVTITGANLTGATSVQFNGTAAGTFTVDSATQIRANVPSGATTGKISVTTPGGTAQSATDFTVTGSGTTTVVIEPFHDAYVALSTPTTVYDVATLRVRKSSSEQLNSFMKFHVTGLTGATIVSAKIRLKVSNASSDGGTLYKVSNFYLGTTSDWLEDGLTWNNAPAISGAALGSAGAVSVGSFVEFTVTSAIPGNGTYSFALTNNASDDAHYSSTEGANHPELVIEATFPSLARGNGAEETPEALPKEFSLSQNYPNPFNGQTTIEYALPEASSVRLAIYNSLGQLVRKLVDELQSPGYKKTIWDGRDEHGQNVGSGIYFYRLDAGSHRMNGRMILQQ